MGIEPLLCVGVFVFGILLQISLALRDGLLRRFRRGIWMRERCARIAGVYGLLGAGEGAWTGEIEGMQVRMWTTVHARSIRRWLRGRTGHWQRRTRRWHQLGEPQLLIVVELAEPLPFQMRLQAAIGHGGHVPLFDPIADQLVRANGDDADAIRSIVRHPQVRGPLYELLGRHPQSVVTQHAVHLWVEGPTKELESLISLARELSGALVDAGRGELDGRAVQRRRQASGY